ncbi:hypothetical protein FD724_33925 (plasmid) [Nostoc sp. C057]|uniref:hypothetical protein n=1 Tax=Nostoc sp. C057 TaxID=2576903 RepID=UPI0015C30B04|nr:hypothetical protein [Nostoc sp. C057]QLE52958.1 hypothetical protein FD724_33925 [Nostoc sp. C057]
MQFLVFIRTEFGERHWKGQANSLQEAEEQAIASINTRIKTISDTSLRCNWHWQNNSGYSDTEYCNSCGNPVYWDGEEYYCSYCARQLRYSEDSGQLYSHEKSV